jgi:hypothetical protein
MEKVKAVLVTLMLMVILWFSIDGFCDLVAGIYHFIDQYIWAFFAGIIAFLIAIWLVVVMVYITIICVAALLVLLAKLLTLWEERDVNK